MERDTRRLARDNPLFKCLVLERRVTMSSKVFSALSLEQINTVTVGVTRLALQEGHETCYHMQMCSIFHMERLDFGKKLRMSEDYSC